MPADLPTLDSERGVALLERSVGYALGCLRLVSDSALDRPTPCRSWPLWMLLLHLEESIAALEEASDGAVRVAAEDALGSGAPALWTSGQPNAPGRGGSPSRLGVGGAVARRVRDQACRMFGSWAGASIEATIVAGLPVDADVITRAGALEVAVHGWDVATACGLRRELPSALAADLLPVAWELVTDADRPARFGPPRLVSPWSCASDRLLAWLGRSA
jgi:uncharacterized protein (TIGR03086 family)